MLPKIIRTGIHRYEGTGVRKTEMATQYRKAYVPVTLDVDKEGAILPRLIWWDNGVIFQIDQILYKCRATSKKVGGGGIRYTVQIRGKESFLFHEGDKWFVEAKAVSYTHLDVYKRQVNEQFRILAEQLVKQVLVPL